MRRRDLGVLAVLLALWTVPWQAPVRADGAPADGGDGACLRTRIEQLLHEAEARGWLGFYFRHGQSAPGELVVVYVYSQGPAEAAGLRLGDRVVGIGDVRFSGDDFEAAEEQFRAVARELRPGTRLPLAVRRGSETLRIELDVAPVRRHALSEFIGRELLSEYFDEQRARRAAQRP